MRKKGQKKANITEKKETAKKKQKLIKKISKNKSYKSKDKPTLPAKKKGFLEIKSQENPRDLYQTKRLKKQKNHEKNPQKTKQRQTHKAE